MATSNQRELVAQTYHAIAELSPGFKVRAQQRAMISRVFQHATTDSIGLIEAPTGTGKSIGYLVPGVIAALTEDRVLVVSTATASLQDQLATKDLPALSQALKAAGICTDLKFAVVKGRERHLCVQKLGELSTNKGLFSEDDDGSIDQLRTVWDSGKWSGLRDTLPITVAPKTWALVANTAATCAGEGCSDYQECPYYASMAAAKDAKIVVANHDYLLTVLANLENSFLCDGASNIYIFDEAHHLEAKLLAAFATSIDFDFSWTDEFIALEQLLGKHTTHALKISLQRMLGDWHVCANAVRTTLGDSAMHRFTLQEVAAELNGLLITLRGTITELVNDLEENLKAVAEAGKRVSRARDGLLALMTMRANAIKSELTGVTACIDEFTDPALERARWLQRGRHSTEVRCTPFDAAEIARTHFWPKIKRAVLTSATLSTLGTFEGICHNIGLPSDTPTLRLDSPLDYSQARLIVPKFSVEATQATHPAMVRAFLLDHAIGSDQLGILVYFTSRAMMRTAFDSLTEKQKELVLMQGDWSVSAMIDEHRKRIDSGRRSILYGLDTLSEGIDLPGNYCTRVIIPRLPFPCPSDPILATHAEYLTKAGIEPFARLSLPRAALKLAQIFGRLIRREGDSGDVMVLDLRLSTKRYGGQMVRSSQFGALSAL